MGVLLRGGRVIDPASGTERAGDILIEKGRIVAIAPSLSPLGQHLVCVDGLVVAPGLVDMHVHLRDPGDTHKEDLASGTAAAVRGGFTAVACMANTTPAIDHATIVEGIRSRAEQVGVCRVYSIGAITKGRSGQELAPIASLVTSGVVGLSDDGTAVANAGLLRRAMMYTTMFDLPIIEHCEDPQISDGGVMHEGQWSTILGLHGIPAAAEETIVARDLLLAEATGARLHIAHVSTSGSVSLIREAKSRGVRVSAEVTPHHLVLTDEAVQGFDPNVKMNPPLRSAADVEQLRAGLLDGTIDGIATDHAPHAPQEKMVEFDRAPFGVIGLETALGVVLTALVRSRVLTLVEALRAMSTVPATILGIRGGRLAVGEPADVVVIDLDREWTVDAEAFASKSRNTPFQGWRLQGKAVLTVVDGKIKYSELPVEAIA